MDDEFNKFGEWEDAWQQAFDGAEHAPPNRVWQGLENSLMDQQLRRYRRKLYLYQWLAAASCMLLGLWAGWWVFFAQPERAALASAQQATQPAVSVAGNPTSSINFPGNTSNTPAASGQQPLAGSRDTGAANPALAESAIAQNSGNSPDQQERQISSDTGVQDPVRRLAMQQNEPIQAVMPRQPSSAEVDNINSAPLSETSEQILAQQPALQGSSSYSLELNLVAVPAELLLADGSIQKEVRVVGIPSLPVSKKSRYLANGDFWLGASLASNYFNPNMSSSSNGLSWAEQPPTGKGAPMVYTANVDDWDNKEKSLPSVDFKIDAAFRLSQRWMFQTSIQYGSYRVNTLTGSFKDYASDKVYPLYYTNFNNNRLQVASPGSRIAAPVDAMNTYRFISVPLSFSYILFEKQVGLALSSGLSSEVFLGGQIDATGNNRLEAYTLSAGKDSPFRRVHFNAQFGVQLFYRAGPNHLLILEPTYKYAITDFQKNGEYFNSRPSQIGVAAGFRFILR